MARAEGASVKLAQMLIKAGIPFDDIPLYAVKGVPSKRMEEQLSLCRVLIFASPSGVRAFKQAGGFCGRRIQKDPCMRPSARLLQRR